MAASIKSTSNVSEPATEEKGEEGGGEGVVVAVRPSSTEAAGVVIGAEIGKEDEGKTEGIGREVGTTPAAAAAAAALAAAFCSFFNLFFSFRSSGLRSPSVLVLRKMPTNPSNEPVKKGMRQPQLNKSAWDMLFRIDTDTTAPIKFPIVPNTPTTPQ
jgi:hypothetical protein